MASDNIDDSSKIDLMMVKVYNWEVSRGSLPPEPMSMTGPRSDRHLLR